MNFTYVVQINGKPEVHTCKADSYDAAYMIIRSRHGKSAKQVVSLSGVMEESQ